MYLKAGKQSSFSNCGKYSYKLAFQKMHDKKVLSDSKAKNKLAILECWTILKEKNNFIFKFSIAIMKLNFLVINELSRWKY
jgi:hypothetical protein